MAVDKSKEIKDIKVWWLVEKLNEWPAQTWKRKAKHAFFCYTIEEEKTSKLYTFWAPCLFFFCSSVNIERKSVWMVNKVYFVRKINILSWFISTITEDYQIWNKTTRRSENILPGRQYLCTSTPKIVLTHFRSALHQHWGKSSIIVKWHISKFPNNRAKRKLYHSYCL